jgi:membrane protein implicated in regulation of membrane protease activity
MGPLFWFAAAFALLFILAEVFLPKYYFGAMGAAFAVLAILSFFNVTNLAVLLFAFLLANTLGLVYLVLRYSKKYYRLHHKKERLQKEKK